MYEKFLQNLISLIEFLQYFYERIMNKKFYNIIRFLSIYTEERKEIIEIKFIHMHSFLSQYILANNFINI